MRPSVRQLECLVATAKHLNFRAAARECHISQPALSAQIARLEQLLGVTLFERNRRHVILTPAGEEIAERAQKLLTELDDLGAAAQAHAQPLGGRLRLGVIPTIAPYVMPRALGLIRGVCPELEILLREEQTARSLELLRDGKLDVLLLALEAELGEVETLPLFQDEFVLAAATGNPLAQRKAIDSHDLKGQRVLLLEDGHCLKDQAWAICQAQGVKDVVDFRATSLGTLAQMVSSGAGITLLPLLSLPSVGSLPGIVVKPFLEPVPYRTIGLAWRPTSPRRSLFETLAGVLRQLAPEGSPSRSRNPAKLQTNVTLRPPRQRAEAKRPASSGPPRSALAAPDTAEGHAGRRTRRSTKRAARAYTDVE